MLRSWVVHVPGNLVLPGARSRLFKQAQGANYQELKSDGFRLCDERIRLASIAHIVEQPAAVLILRPAGEDDLHMAIHEKKVSSAVPTV